MPGCYKMEAYWFQIDWETSNVYEWLLLLPDFFQFVHS